MEKLKTTGWAVRRLSFDGKSDTGFSIYNGWERHLIPIFRLKKEASLYAKKCMHRVKVIKIEIKET